jgi:hypothetical protein
MNNIAEPDCLRRIKCDTERLKFIDSLLADNKYLFPVVECEMRRLCVQSKSNTERVESCY